MLFKNRRGGYPSPPATGDLKLPQVKKPEPKPLDLSSWEVAVGFADQLYIKHGDCEDGFDYLQGDRPTLQDLVDLAVGHKCPNK